MSEYKKAPRKEAKTPVTSAIPKDGLIYLFHLKLQQVDSLKSFKKILTNRHSFPKKPLEQQKKVSKYQPPPADLPIIQASGCTSGRSDSHLPVHIPLASANSGRAHTLHENEARQPLPGGKTG